MAERRRQLAAIVFTDIVGYSALMRADEERARAIRRRHREVFDRLTPAYGGEILQYYGDGTLSIFSSSVAAVECAVEMQRAFREAPEVPLRIGIHTGDIIHDDTELFGDGVNVASRIEPCCISGGVFVTGRVYDDVRNHDWVEGRRLGSFTFKGLDGPVDVYALTNEGLAVPTEEDVRRISNPSAKLVRIEPASPSLVPERIRQLALVSIPILLLALIFLNLYNPLRGSTEADLLPLVEQDALAVLPFDNISPEPEDDYFSDGITEEILALLSKIEGLKVVSRRSSMQYKGSAKDIRKIGRELKARHILEGSVRRAGNRVRITTQLIDAREDRSLWTETYDREITEIFELQSQVAKAIARSLQKQLSARERAMIAKKPTQSVLAYDYYLRGREHYSAYTPEENKRAIQLFHQAVAIDSSFALAYAGLGDALAQEAMLNMMNERLLDSAITYSLTAIRLDGELSEGYKALGLAYHLRGWYERALQQYFRAIDRNPNNEMALNNIAMIYKDQGQYVDAIRWARKALAINPQHTWSLLNLSGMYRNIGADAEARALLQQGLADHPRFIPFRQGLAYLYMTLEKYDRAKKQAQKLLESHPESSTGYALLGELALRQGQYDDARAFLRESREHQVDDAYEPLPYGLYEAYLQLREGPSAEAEERLRNLVGALAREGETALTAEGLVPVAMGFALLGEPDRALTWLRRAAKRGWMDFRLARQHPFFDSLRDRAEFRRLLHLLEERQRAVYEQVLQSDEPDRLT